MKIALAEVKHRLRVGTEFIGEFVGINAHLCKAGMQRTRRRVVKNTGHQLVSEFLDGPRAGSQIYLQWANNTADERDGSIHLTMTEVNPPDEYLKITVVTTEEVAKP